MRESQRKNLLNKAIRKGEIDAGAKLEALFKQRYNVLKRELRRSNLRKRLYKAQRDNISFEKAGGVDWGSWINQFTGGLSKALGGIVDSIHGIESRYWSDRGTTLQPLNADDIINQYMQRGGRQITNIAEDTQKSVLNEISAWYNSDEDLPQLIDRLGQYFSPERAAMIAKTESGFIASEVARVSMEQAGVTQWNVILGVEEDGYPCQLCIDKSDANPHEIDDESPPFHPRCRCLKGYVVEG